MVLFFVEQYFLLVKLLVVDGAEFVMAGLRCLPLRHDVNTSL